MRMIAPVDPDGGTDGGTGGDDTSAVWHAGDMGRVTRRTRVLAVDLGADEGDRGRGRADVLSVEEPLELRIGGSPLSVTMRTPGHDIELVHGFLVSEGVISSVEDVVTARYCEGAVTSGETGFDENTYNVISVQLADHVPSPESRIARNFVTSSACGVCGSATLDNLRGKSAWSLEDDPTTWPATLVADLPESLRTHQKSFAQTGGLHAAGLFTADGTPLVVREDVGRHNAVDKVVGWALLNGHLPARGCILMVSGRASFELAQKAVMAGIPALAAVSAPSSLAVDVATDQGMTLVGFLRPPRFNVYAGAERILLDD